MPVQIGICDDSMDDIKALSAVLLAYDRSFQLSAFFNGEALLRALSEQKVKFDIIFLDIYMPEQNGIEIARKIRANMKNVKIIFVSSSNDHYPEAFDVFAFNYLLKPIEPEKVISVVITALDDNGRERRQTLSFTYKAKAYKVLCRDIMYIESKDKMVYFHMENKNIMQCYERLDEILKKLPPDYFVRCHQSFVVNIYHVNEMEENHFRINSDVINISRKYLKSSKDKYFSYLFTHIDRGQ